MANKIMSWIHTGKSIPIDSKNFQNIIYDLLFLCPVCIRSTKKRAKTEFKPVSVQKCDFHSRHIAGNLLTTILADIRRPIAKIGGYASIDSKGDVVGTVNSIICSSTNSDSDFEILVYKKRSNMSESEAIFYYIRNAFAHGSFEYVSEKQLYKLESKKDTDVKAQMRLKESTLLRYCQLARMDVKEITKLQRRKAKSRKQLA